MSERRINYRYDECGLDNVILEDFPVQMDEAGDEVITIPNVNVLHQVLVSAVAHKEGGLNPKEIRFLRSEMGMSQAELAKLIGRDGQTIGRWERGETNIDQTAEIVLRMKAIEFTGWAGLPIDELASRTVYSAEQKPIVIDAADPTHYPRKTAA
ncbi:helix-turn-helix domain-containing protein [Maricaulis maris]|jgi:DNA-binding transcriptional regulator YiaG|uniref:helix-turn-helix domain-containing protein n=1 Tax=Maricaulis maris TaxID=74318 RepID=UPI002922A223|nr:transcriptional regulator [Maricaulis maris]